jgi:hypothetical protein
MPDLTSWVTGAAAVKTAFDTLKSAIGLVKEAKDLLPADDQREKAIRDGAGFGVGVGENCRS